MKGLNPYVLLFVVFLFSFAFVLAEENSTTDSSETEGFSAQNGFDWLVDQIDSDGSVDSDVTKTAYVIMALDAAGYDTSGSQTWLEGKLASDFCYPTGACTVPETSLAVLALNEVQDDGHFDDISSWYSGALSDADVSGNWYLEAVTSSNGTCVVSYELEGTLKEVNVAVDGGVFTGCGDSHFLDLDECLQAGLISSNPGMSIDVNCADIEGSVVLAHLYKSSSTYYLLANENSANADFQINNGCFGKAASGSCDVESTLYGDWALTKLQSTINTLVYLKENYDDTNPKRVALMYLVTKDESYLEDLASLQKSDGSFDRDHYTTALAVLALSDSSVYSTNIDNAKSYLRGEQTTDGDWEGSVENTAFILYAAFSEEDVSPSEISTDSDDEVVSECDTNSDCELLYGDGYGCDGGSCVYEGIGCNDDTDCDSGEVCIDDACVESDCDYGEHCKDGKVCCDYGYSVCGSSGKQLCNENVYNCARDCYCGDGVCDDVESDSDSGDDYYCAEDCAGEEDDTDDTEDTSDEAECSSNSDCDEDEKCSYGSCVTVEDEGGSGIVVVIIVLLLLVCLGVGGYFAYKKGYLDSLLSKFKKGGGKGPSSGYAQGASAYNPYTSKVGQPQGSPFGGGAQQPKRPF